MKTKTFVLLNSGDCPMKKAYGRLLLVALGIVFALTSFTAYSNDYKEIFKDLHDQMNQFRKSEVHPEMLKWKAKLDGAMSEEDLATLNELRAQAAELRDKMHEEMKKKREEMKEKYKNGDIERGERRGRGKRHGRQRGDNNPYKDEMKEIAEQVIPLAKEYRETLEEIGKTAKASHDEWKEVMKEIFESWKEKYADELEELDGKRKKHMKRGMKRMGPEGFFSKGENNKKAVIRFMLWDGSEPEEKGMFDENGPAFEPTSVETVLLDNEEVNVYPNPATDVAKIEFFLQNQQNVELTIIDNSGRTIEILHSGILGAGEHSFDFDTSKNNLPAGNYIYQLKTESGTRTGKFIVE